jgi:hypothetical protein
MRLIAVAVTVVVTVVVLVFVLAAPPAKATGQQDAAAPMQTQPQTQTQARRQTLLGVVDEAGIVTTIIHFDGVRWRSSWPAPDEKLADMPLPSSLHSVPIAWTGLPLPARWYAWPWPREAPATGGANRAGGPDSGGGARSAADSGHADRADPAGREGRTDRAGRAISVTKPVRYDAHCVPGVGLQSDLRDSKAPTGVSAFPKRKLALALSNADLRVEPVADVRTGDAAERGLLLAAETFFHANVKDGAAAGADGSRQAAARDDRLLSADNNNNNNNNNDNNQAGDGRRIDVAELHNNTRVRVRWTGAWSYAVPDSDERIYLLEGHDREVDVITGFLWIRVKNGTPVEHRGGALVDDVDHKRTERRRPMGVISVGSRRFWFSEVNGYEHEAYELIELTSPRFPAVLTISGGGC